MSNLDLPMPEGNEGNFSTDSMQDSITEIHNDAVSQQVLLLNLKQKKIDLEEDIRQKWQELSKVNEEQRLLEAELNNHQMHLKDVEELQTVCQQKMAHTRDEVEEVRQQLSNEKDKQLRILTSYEVRMASISKKLIEAPAKYRKENLRKEITLLCKERANIQEELASVGNELELVKSRFLQLVIHEDHFDSLSGEASTPSALKFIITQMEEDISLCDTDVQTLHEELKSLEQVSTGLRGELEQMKTKQ